MILGEITFIGVITIQSSMAVLFAVLGEIITERSGVLNLGLEGIMLMGALTGFAASLYTENLWFGVLCAAITGGLMSLLHAVFVITLKVNQVVSGLSLAVLGTGLSNYLGRPLVGKVAGRFMVKAIPVLEKIPVLGPVFFQQNLLVYLAYFLVPCLTLFLFKTKFGLYIRAVGEKPSAADTLGINIFRIRYLCTIFGGILTGIGGAYLSLSYTPGWKEGMTGGQGWIAIAMVIFSMWNPLLGIAGALFFGFINALQFYFQASMVPIPGVILRLLPYLCTIIVLLAVTIKRRGSRRFGAPASLGTPYSREEY